MMVLKRAYGPAIAAGLPILPTYIFSLKANGNFARAYRDAGLLQTSQLDGWAKAEPTSVKKREDFRQWLVDCHKASFVPICLASVEDVITAEPAAVVPIGSDTDRVQAATSPSTNYTPAAAARAFRRKGDRADQDSTRRSLNALKRLSSIRHF